MIYLMRHGADCPDRLGGWSPYDLTEEGRRQASAARGALLDKLPRPLIAQPGLRYAQASALIESLLLDPAFSDLSITERNSVRERILNEIMGRMMEDAVLLETKLAQPKKRVFVLQFAIGEFDMVVFDPAAGSCEIYEIKHSAETAPEQLRHLLDEEKCKMTEHRFGTITGKYVIYRGPAKMAGDVRYLNVEAYLCGTIISESPK